MRQRYVMKAPFWAIALYIKNRLYPIISYIDGYKKFHGYLTSNTLTDSKLLTFKNFETAINRIKKIKLFYGKHRNSPFNDYEIVLIKVDNSVEDTIVELLSKGIFIA